MAAKKQKPETNYSDLKLRERLKKKIVAGDKGGKPGQWSARKAQLLTHEYEAAGGKYVGGPTATQKNLKKWTKEKWQTSDSKPAIRPAGTTRYLPEKAWSKLDDAEKKSTSAKKRSGSRKGEQFVANTAKAKTAAAAARSTKGNSSERKPRSPVER